MLAMNCRDVEVTDRPSRDGTMSALELPRDTGGQALAGELVDDAQHIVALRGNLSRRIEDGAGQIGGQAEQRRKRRAHRALRRAPVARQKITAISSGMGIPGSARGMPS